MQQLKNILPGLILSTIVAALGKWLAIFIPSIGAATIAIFLGIFLGNTFFQSKIFSDGTKFSESKLLEFSIFFLGVSLSFQTIAALGMNSVIFIILQMTLTIIAAIYIGKKLKVSSNIYLLMASGNAVCGSSAVAATAPAIDADEESKGIVITIVNLLGTVLMLILPLLTLFFYNNETLQSSALIGGILQSVGQVVASGSMVNDAVLEQATIFKIMRIIMLVVVVFVLSQYNQYERKKTRTVEENRGKVSVAIPWYVIAFFVACTANSLGLVPQVVQPILKYWSGWFEIIALAAIGLRLNLRALLAQGKKLMIFGATIGITQVAVGIVLIYILF